MDHTQPLTLPFPGVPAWRLFICTCWLDLMPEDGPHFPAHIEAAQVIEVPKPGDGVGCRRCDSFYLHREIRGDWAKFHIANIRMSGAERLMHYTEGVANEHLDADAPGVDLDFKPEP